MKKLLAWFVVLLALTITAAPSASEKKSIVELDDDERLIESAGLRSEGPGLLEFFRGRANTEASAGRVDELVRRFSGQSVEDRVQAGTELVALGPIAIPGLRRVVNELETPEVRDRARR